MILNYKLLPNGAAINIFPISDSDVFNQHADWKDLKAYYFTGLDFRMLICPFRFATDEPLLQRPGLYLKSTLPIGGIVYFPQLPKNYNENNFLDDLAWMVDSYLFRFNASRIPLHNKPLPRLYVDSLRDTYPEACFVLMVS